MFIAKNLVRMHDTDMAGILYFPRQFRFAHDALEDFLASLGYDYEHVLHMKKFIFVVVHAEANYYEPLHVGDKLEVKVTVSHVGRTSFTICYNIYKSNHILTGTAKTVHVTLDAVTREKIHIPESLKVHLEEHLEPETPHHA